MGKLTDYFEDGSRQRLITATPSKADFFARAEQRKKETAGSGMLEHGKIWVGAENNKLSVNEGLWNTSTDGYQQTIRVGRDALASGSVGNSKTGEASILLDGIKHRLYGLAGNPASGDDYGVLKFPPAPDGSKTYDSATGIVTQHTSANEAFEGLFTNGDFRNGLSNWSLDSASSAVVTNGVLEITRNSAGEGDVEQLVSVAAGTYRFEFHGVVTDSPNAYIILVGSLDGVLGQTAAVPTGVQGKGKSIIYEVSISESQYINVILRPGNVGTVFKISSCSAMPSSEEVITSRRDLVLFENWHEDIEQKDRVHYLGLVQSGVIRPYAEVAKDTIARNDGYTRFGVWDTSTIGREYIWSELTTDEKLVFINDPENNIYYDATTRKFIQVKARARVIEGLGDNWTEVNYRDLAVSTDLRYDSASRINQRGALTNGTDYTNNSIYGDSRHSDIESGTPQGAFRLRKSRRDDSIAYGGHSSIMPILLASRLNKGGYHPVYNKLGTRLWVNDSGVGAFKWAQVGDNVNSPYQCFSNWHTNGAQPWTSDGRHGDVTSGESGRNDQYLYHDAVYAGMCEDLRLPAEKLDVDRLMREKDVQATTAKMRGKQTVPFTVSATLASESLTSYLVFDKMPHWWHKLELTNNSSSIVSNAPNYLSNKWECRIYQKVDADPSFNNKPTLRVRNQLLNTESHGLSAGDTVLIQINIDNNLKDSLPWVNIIGDPIRIAATFPNGVVGQWIPEVPTNSSQTYNLTKKCSQSTSTPLNWAHTTNDGASWNSGTSAHGTGAHETNTWYRVDNTVTQSLNVNSVALYYYEAESDFTETTSAIHDTRAVGNVWFGSYFESAWGNRKQESLTGQIGTNGSLGISQKYVELSEFNFRPDTQSLDWFNLSDPQYEYNPLSFPTAGAARNEQAAGVKSLVSLVQQNGLYYLMYNGAELRYTTAGFRQWGDNCRIRIADNGTLDTDTNGTTVQVHCHRTMIPIGIADSTLGGGQ